MPGLKAGCRRCGPLLDLGSLVERYFASGKAALLSVGEQIDTRSAAGRLVLNVLASVSRSPPHPASSKDGERAIANSLRKEGLPPRSVAAAADVVVAALTPATEAATERPAATIGRAAAIEAESGAGLRRAAIRADVVGAGLAARARAAG